MSKGYIVMQVGFDYDDECYSTGNYGTTYDAPDKVYLSKEKAIAELDRQTIEKLRGENLGHYNGNGLEGICKKGKIDEFIKIFKEEFDVDVNNDSEKVPKTATDEQIRKVMECLSLEFYELMEVEIETD